MRLSVVSSMFKTAMLVPLGHVLWNWRWLLRCFRFGNSLVQIQSRLQLDFSADSPSLSRLGDDQDGVGGRAGLYWSRKGRSAVAG